MKAPAGQKGRGGRVAQLRFLVFLLLLAAAFVLHRLWWPQGQWQDAVAMAFDFAVLIFLGSLLPLLRNSSAESMRRRAKANDANRWIVLLMASLLSVVIMLAIYSDVEGARRGDFAAIAKLVATLALVWLFANSVYSLHYAHMYYDAQKEAEGDRRGLRFPGTDTPDYVDFAYFAFTIGMTFQTSDVEVTQRRVRLVAVLHSAAAFVFNIGVIAFTINALGGGGGS